MFRTARGFLLVAPPAFLLALVSFLSTHPNAAEAFTPYPFLTDALGRALTRRPVERFAVVSAVSFLFPYLVSGLLLFLADLGFGAARRLWGGKPGQPHRRMPGESVVTFVAVTLVSSVAAGWSLHRVAHGGELPGGVNVAPLFVAAVPYVAVAVAFLLAGLASVPRSVARLLSGGRSIRVERVPASSRNVGGGA
jgi:hypothetical protein